MPKTEMQIDTAQLSGTVKDLEESLERLAQERGKMDERIGQVQSRLDYWQKLLERSTNGGGGRRLRKGEAVKMIQELLKSQPNLTMAEIEEKKPDIPSGSIRRILTTREDLFEVDADKRWKPKTQT